uniref:Uncharacterized protein n=1 Tax=Geobacter metallireducens TaxID=28232 RepID=A0A831UF74_GEOME
MGFFADIIRDSRRGGPTVTPAGAPAPFGAFELPVAAPEAVDGGGVEPASTRGSEVSVIRLREEGGGTPVTAEQSLAQAGAAARQVVGPSPSEHTPVAGIPEAMDKGVTLPIPGKREQAGSESDRTASGDFRVEAMESFHDGGSSDVPAVSVSANDSPVRESSSGYAASRAGKVSVETQGRRQAGETRAGSATPPDGYVGEVLGTPFTPGEEEPATGSLRRAFGEAMEVPSIPRHQPPAAQAPEKVSPSDREPAADTSRVPVLPVGEVWEPFGDGRRHDPLHAPIPLAAVSSPSVSSRVENFQRVAERQLPPLPREGDEGKTPVRSIPPPEPQVRIGTIEVVVVTPAPAERTPRSGERMSPDLASRHYLRNF